MTKNRFLTTAKPILVTIGTTPLQGTPREFSTGSCGYNFNGKVQVQLPDGSIGKLQVSGNLIVVGSKEWPVGEAAAA